MSAKSFTVPRGLRTLHAFQSPSYRLLWLANLFAYVARMMQITLLGWLVLELTDSPWLVALVGFFNIAPMFLLGAFGGVLADRVDRRRLLVATQAANLAAALAMTLLLATEEQQPWHAYLVAAVAGAGWALDMPSRRSVLHDLLGRSGVTNGVALDSVAHSASGMLGPALAGALIALAGFTWGYAAISMCYLTALALLWWLRLPRTPRPVSPSGVGGVAEGPASATGAGVLGRPARRGSPPMLSNLMEGLRYARGNNTILAVLLITVLMNLLLFPYVQMVPVIARDVLGVGPGLMGLLMATEGLGALAGAVVVASRGDLSYHGRLFLGGSIVAMLAGLLFSLSHWYLVSLPILLVLGLGQAGFGTMQATLIMLVAREEMRGRALGVLSLAIGSGPFGALLIGAVASAKGPSFAIALNTCLGMVGLALVALLMPSLRQRILPEEGRQSSAGDRASRAEGAG